MKILYVVNVCPGVANGSAPPFVKAQIDSVQRAGHHISIYTIRGNLSKWNYFKALIEVQRLIRKECFDIIHAHYAYSGLVAALQRKVPVIISFMGSDLLGSYKTNGTLNLRGHIDAGLSKILQFLVDGIIVKSEGMREILRKKEKSIILPNGINFGQFKEMPRDQARKRLGLDLEKKIVLFVGNHRSQNKCFPIISEAVDVLRDNDAKIELVVVHGIDHEVIPYYLNASNVLVLASIKEGSPNIIKEAMACNLPILATDVGDVKEVISGVKGCKIIERDKRAIAKGIKEILDNFQRTDGREAVEHLSLECVADRLIEFYHQIAKSENLHEINSSQLN
jgi:glycosyltransferase involved in cell wall biosynthesis